MGQIKHSNAQAEQPSSQEASAAKIQVGSEVFPCFDLLRVYAKFFRVWHFLFVFFLFPTALPSAMLMPVNFCTVCALLVVSNMWGVCFAVFVH